MLFGLSACENELELDTKTASKQLSVNGFINADSTVNRLLVSFTGIDHPTIVTDATIKVSVNGNLRETVRELPAGSEQYIIHGRFNPGDHVRIEVSTPDNNYQATIGYTEKRPPTDISPATWAVRTLPRATQSSWKAESTHLQPTWALPHPTM